MTLPAPVDARVRIRNAGVAGPLGGGVYVSELQRLRLLDAAFAVVAEGGYKRMTARRVSGRARVSNKTFYDLFADREDCFLAAFDYAVEELATVVLPAWEGEKEWVTRVRAGLGVLLELLDCEPALRELVFVEALGAGPRVLERRAQVLVLLQNAVDEGRADVKAARGLPPLTAEGVVGAAFGVIHTRLHEQHPEPLRGLCSSLMAMIVLPYRGREAAARELARPVPESLLSAADLSPRVGVGCLGGPAAGSSAPVDFRLTLRMHSVLVAVTELQEQGVNPNNRQVADAAGVADQGQMSKLLARLEGLGLLQNTGVETPGFPRAWQLTSRGEGVLQQATQTVASRTPNRTNLQVNGTRETR